MQIMPTLPTIIPWVSGFVSVCLFYLQGSSAVDAPDSYNASTFLYLHPRLIHRHPFCEELQPLTSTGPTPLSRPNISQERFVNRPCHFRWH